MENLSAIDSVLINFSLLKIKRLNQYLTFTVEVTLNRKSCFY